MHALIQQIIVFVIVFVIPNRDGDGVQDEEDNCVDVSNADQADSDNDGLGEFLLLLLINLFIYLLIIS